MKCPACGWTNPASYQNCFSCRRPLSPAARPAAPQRGAQSEAQTTVFASKGACVLATVVDLVLIGLPFVLALVVLVVFGSREGGNLPLLLGAFGVAALLALHPAVLDALGQGSIGYRMTGLRVVDSHGERPGLLQSLLRQSIKYGAHLCMPLVLKFIENIAFKRRSVHDVVAQTYVVERKASAEAVRAALAHPQPGQWFSVAVLAALGGVVLIVMLAVAVVAGSALFGEHKVNPRYDAAGATKDAAVPLTVALGNYYAARGSFPASLADAGVVSLPGQIRATQVNPLSGVLTVTSALPEIAGARLVFAPEFKIRQGQRMIKRWRCGSPDLSRSDSPSFCSHDLSAVAAPNP